MLSFANATNKDKISQMQPVENQPLMPKNEQNFISVVKDIANKDGAKTGNNLKSYTWGLDLSGTEQGAGGVGGLLAMTVHSSSKTCFYTYDGNGNVTGLVDSDNGTLVTEYEYGPFGELISDGGDVVNPFRFSTKYTDAETGLIYYGYRYYSSDLGRFINRDSLEELGGLNIYGFVGNNAITWIDVLGMYSWNELWIDTLDGAIAVSEFAQGVGDGATLGATTWINKRLVNKFYGEGTDKIIDKVKRCSNVFFAGQISGTIATLWTGATGAAKAAGGLKNVPLYELGTKWIPNLGKNKKILDAWNSLTGVQKGRMLLSAKGGKWLQALRPVKGGVKGAFTLKALFTGPTPASGSALWAFSQVVEYMGIREQVVDSAETFYDLMAHWIMDKDMPPYSYKDDECDCED